MSGFKIHIIDPTDLDHSLCGRDFRTIQESVQVHMLDRVKQMKLEKKVCLDCRKELDISLKT